MSAAQWVALLVCVFVCSACLLALVQEFRADQRRHRLAAIERSIAAAVAAEERSIDDWLQLALAVGVLPLEPTPIHDRLVCEELERLNGWAS